MRAIDDSDEAAPLPPMLGITVADLEAGFNA
jgi:hypothetical protein